MLELLRQLAEVSGVHDWWRVRSPAEQRAVEQGEGGPVWGRFVAMADRMSVLRQTQHWLQGCSGQRAEIYEKMCAVFEEREGLDF